MTSKNKRVSAPTPDSDEEDVSSEEEEDLMLDQNFAIGFETTQTDSSKKPAADKHNFIHLHFVKRNARQSLTSVRGLPDDLDMRKLTRHFKKAWSCNGSIKNNAEYGEVIQLQGDHRRGIYKFLIEEGIAVKENIKIHGY